MQFCTERSRPLRLLICPDDASRSLSISSQLLREITPGDVDEWRLSLVRSGLSDNTIRRRCGIAKQFFNAAMRK
jgi:hypothetical protein